MRRMSGNQRAVAEGTMGLAIIGIVFVICLVLWPKIAEHVGKAARVLGRAKGEWQAGTIEGEKIARDARAALNKVTVELKETRK